MKRLYGIIILVAFAVGLFAFNGGGVKKYLSFQDDTSTVVFTMPYDFSPVAVEVDSLDGTSQMHWLVGSHPDSMSVVKADTGVIYTKWPDTTGGSRSLPLLDLFFTPYIQGVTGEYGNATAQDSATQVNSTVDLWTDIL